MCVFFLCWKRFLKFSILFHRGQSFCLFGNIRPYPFDNTGKIFEKLVNVNTHHSSSTTNAFYNLFILEDLITVYIFVGNSQPQLKQNWQVFQGTVRHHIYILIITFLLLPVKFLENIEWLVLSSLWKYDGEFYYFHGVTFIIETLGNFEGRDLRLFRKKYIVWETIKLLKTCSIQKIISNVKCW